MLSKILLALFLLFVAASTHAQGVRISGAVTAQGTIGTATNAVVLPSGPTIAICNHPANGVPCNNYATTYTDATLTTACSMTQQIVLDGHTNCVSTPDSQNNWGAWVKPGAYDYTITLPGSINQGPFYVIASLPVNPNVQIVSTVPTGTAPFSIASTTVVPNLDAQLLNGQTAPASAILGLTDTQSPTNKTINVGLNSIVETTPSAGKYLRDNGTSFQPSSIAAAGAGSCSGVQFPQTLNDNAIPGCVTPPTFVASGASHAVGYVPDPGSSAGTTRFLREDSTWVAPSAGGGVTTVYNTTASAAAATIGSTTMVTAPASDTNYDFGALVAQTVATAGCSGQPSFQLEIIYTDAFTGSSRTVLPLVNQLGNSGTFNNAQSFAAALSAATTYSARVSIRAKASTTVSYTVVYTPSSGCSPGASYSIAPVLVQD